MTHQHHSNRESSDPRKNFENVVRSFDTAMLVTRGPGGALNGRPLSIAAIEPGGELWFTTGAASAKVRELVADPHVGVVMQSASRYASVAGVATLVEDRARARALWREAWRPWFPGGPEDPELVLLRIRVEDAEYWDLSGAKGLSYVASAVKHYVRGERMGDGPSLHHDRIHASERPSPSDASGIQLK